MNEMSGLFKKKKFGITHVVKGKKSTMRRLQNWSVEL